MKLLGRTTRIADLDQCLRLVRNHASYDEVALRALRNMWFTVLTEDVGRSAVVYDSAQKETVLAFWLSIAIDKQQFEAILTDGEPHIGRTMLDRYRSHRNAMLAPPALKEANARGNLHIAVAYDGIHEGLEPATTLSALSLLREQLVAQHEGLNLAALLHEAYGVSQEHIPDLAMNVAPYHARYESSLEKLPNQRRPMLLTMTREQAQRHPGNLVLNRLFLRFTPPQCGLSTLERRLLRFAAEGLEDEAVADALHISRGTLKKRWSAIYAAMAHVTQVPTPGDPGQRGPEIRRHVLRYVRHHPEELNAYAEPTRSTRTQANTRARA